MMDGPVGSISDDLRRLETRSLVSRARDMLFDSIISGKFGDGRLPSEPELATRLGVSRQTVRGALRSLENQGLITRQRGVGTIINHHVLRSTVSLNRVVGFHRLVAESGHEAEIAWTKVREEDAPPEVALQVGCEPGEPLVCLDRLLLADGKPAIHLIEMVPKRSLRTPLDGEVIPDSIFDFADAYCRESVDHTLLEIGSVVANARLASLLDIPQDTPLVRLIELHYSGNGSPIMMSEIHVNERYIRLAVIRTRG